MAARTLVQALEGVHFPCDRAQLLDYARRNNVEGDTLAVLEEIPEGRYRDLGEVFTALPGVPPQPEAAAMEGGGEGELPPLPAPVEWWLNGWQQVMMPWEVAAHCLRGSVETWPQWLRLTRHLWFPWSK